MIKITTLGIEAFEADGVPYTRIFQPIKVGESSVAIIGIYDSSQIILGATTFDEIQVDGVIYVSQKDLMLALINVVSPFPEGVESGVYSVNGKIGAVVLSAPEVGAISEAPQDGKTYARSNGQWVESSQFTNSVKYCGVSDVTATDETIIKGLKHISIKSGTLDYKYQFVAVRNSTQRIVIYSYDNNGDRGDDIRIVETDDTFKWLSDTTYSVEKVANGDVINIIYDESHITKDAVSLSSPLVILYDFYEVEEIAPLVEYCNLGASTSGKSWHQLAVDRLRMNWRSFNVGACKWVCFDGYAYDTSSEPIQTNNSMMNQISRLILAKEEGYSPDVISIMCSLTDASHIGKDGYILGTVADALLVNPLDYSAQTWENAPTEWHKNFAISVFCGLRYIADAFPYSQIILCTAQDAALETYPTAQIINTNSILEEFANRLSITFNDLFATCGWSNALGTIANFSDDGVHPNSVGNVALANVQEKALQNIIALKK